MANSSRVNLIQNLLILGLRIYRAAISPILSAIFCPLGFGCRFDPTCSQYAVEAVRRHGSIRGGILTVRRLCRCHPWGGCGDDPVPPSTENSRRNVSESDCLRTSVAVAPGSSHICPPRPSNGS